MVYYIEQRYATSQNKTEKLEVDEMKINYENTLKYLLFNDGMNLFSI